MASASSSPSSRRYDVFPSFSGVDVRKTFLSHLIEALDRRSINTFMDHGIVRSSIIADALISAIGEARISIVIFSKNYASSTWCLNELVEIHKCYEKGDQMVIPVFYGVDPSEVRKQIGKFGDVFKKTCEDKLEDHKQKWVKALTDISNLAGEDLRNGYGCLFIDTILTIVIRPSEAAMVVKIADDVSNKLFPLPKGFGDLVGIEDHIEAIKLKLCLESKEARIMVGIWGQSGIGKSTIGRALYSQLSRQFHHRAFVTYKSTSGSDVSGMKLSWEKELLSEILGQKDIKIEHFGVVEQRLKHKKVLILLDDVDNLEFLKTLVGKAEWFGSGSRIIVITQDRQLLKAHEIDLVYEVELPSQGLALKMICRSAFGKDSPPDDFKELAFEVAKLAGNLPLGLSVLGSSLKGRDKEEWMEMLAELQNGLKEDIMKILRVSYIRLDEKDQYMFRYIAWLFNGWKVKSIKDFLGDGVNVNIRLKTLDDKSLIRLTLNDTIEMHNLLQKLATEIDREESNGNPGKRRFLENAEEILDVFTDNTGTEKLLGIHFRSSSDSQIDKPFISIDENSFQGMLNLQYLKIHDHSWWQPRETRMRLPNGLVYLPRKLKWLWWDNCPLKRLPSNFKAEYLVELRMVNSDLEKLWNGTQLLGSLKKMILRNSKYLKEIPDLSYAMNLERLDISDCEVLESFPSPLNSESLEYLDLLRCPKLRNFPETIMQISPYGIDIDVADCLWNKSLPGLDYLACLRRCNPSKFLPEHLVNLKLRGNNMLEKLWEGVQSLGKLERMDLSECENLTEIPDLSKATNLKRLYLSGCKSLVTLPSTIGNLQKLVWLEMKECTGLELLPTDVNLSSLIILDLSGCSSLRTFPLISKSIKWLYLENTAIEEVPCCIEDFTRLSVLLMYCCQRLKNISPNIFRLRSLMFADFTDCRGVIKALSDATVVATMEDHVSCVPLSENIEYTCERFWDELYLYDDYNDEADVKYFQVDWDFDGEYFSFRNCFKLERDARELILRSCFKPVALPGGEIPKYFTYRANGDSLTVTLPQSFLSQEFLRFKACVVVEPLSKGKDFYPSLKVNVGGKQYEESFFNADLQFCKTDHLFFCSFKFQPEDLPSKLTFNDVEFKFCCSNRIKECGVRLLYVSQETEYNQPTTRSKKRMRMTSGTSEEYINLADTGLAALNLELSLGQGEPSSSTSLEGEALCVDYMITEEQDKCILFLVTEASYHSFLVCFRITWDRP
ncbi:putative 17-beta-estradiol 17-dehydrogenase [Arabidopsis thaliana]